MPTETKRELEGLGKKQTLRQKLLLGTKKGIFYNIDYRMIKMLNKPPGNWNHQGIKRIIHYDQMKLFQECKVASRYGNHPVQHTILIE